MIDLPVINASTQKKLGRVVDITATFGQVYPKITGLFLKVKEQKSPVYISWTNIQNTTYKKNISVEISHDTFNARPTDQEILLKKTFLDKQIISTSGFKVVRVNDLQFLLDDSTKKNPNLWLVHIDIGIKGLLRRLGWLPVFNAIIHWIISRDIKDKFVPWKYVQPTSTTDAFGSLHLKVDSSRLLEIHPADLADIVEDLGFDERVSIMESLDPNTAALTLQEIPLKIRIQLSEMLEPARLARIIDEMDMDEAVDLLDELTPSNRNAIYAMLEQEKVSELKELSKLSAYSVGSIMTTDFLTAKPSDSVVDVLNAVKKQAMEAELIYYVYIVDDNEHLIGTVTLRELLTAEPEMIIADIMSENVISVEIDTSIKRVAQIFFKYNFEAVPVVDDEQSIQGIITLRDALESVFPEMKED